MKLMGKTIFLAHEPCFSTPNIIRRPEAFLLSELVDWMCEKSNRDAVDYAYKRTELFLAPSPWIKTILIQGFPIGQKKFFGPHTIERLERVS